MSKNVIYYFSGTGNSYMAAKTIAQALGGAQLISVTCDPAKVSAKDADVIGFVSPVYEWDVPATVKSFIEKLEVNPDAYIFAVSTYIFIHGRAFETVENCLNQKGAHLSYGKGAYCVASQCTAYPPFPSTKVMLPIMERQFKKIASDIVGRKKRKFPRMSVITRKTFDKRMGPYLKIASEYDKGFYVSEDCAHCGICAKVCPLSNIVMENGNPKWHNTNCHGCMACAAYCPKKAILFKPPVAYVESGMFLANHLKLDKKRKRYHHPHVKFQELATRNKYIE